MHLRRNSSHLGFIGQNGGGAVCALWDRLYDFQVTIMLTCWDLRGVFAVGLSSSSGMYFVSEPHESSLCNSSFLPQAYLGLSGYYSFMFCKISFFCLLSSSCKLVFDLFVECLKHLLFSWVFFELKRKNLQYPLSIITFWRNKPMFHVLVFVTVRVILCMLDFFDLG